MIARRNVALHAVHADEFKLHAEDLLQNGRPFQTGQLDLGALQPVLAGQGTAKAVTFYQLSP